jgi:ubiquinone/menaquinone biosynthesis C-methylase UbiE
MRPAIYESVFLALRKELKDRGYTAQEVEALVKEYSWFLSEYSLLGVLLRSKLPIEKCQQSLDFLVERHDFLREKIEAKSTVLDVGCGFGILACLLAKKNCRVFGIDIEDDRLRVARRLSEILHVNGLCTFKKAESNTLPFDTLTLDYVILSWTLHDIKPEDREPLLSECVRVLKHRGKLLILDPESQLNFDQLRKMMAEHAVKRTQQKIISDIYDHGTLSNAVLVIYQKKIENDKKSAQSV